ncbi:hypothetical protein [Ulvibacterium sp.]|uniref:hypothetical protein n=1 Tax=Ulvibacterium sp. TaxID=2665914 RepID=UPI002602E00E|nr:hypothetical protein [Ulvibacterium sp.]
MERVKVMLIAFLGLIISCTEDDGRPDDIENANGFNARLLRQTTAPGLGQINYFYNDRDELILITKTNSETSRDSTYLEYDDGILSRVLQRIYYPIDDVVNIETIFTQFTATNANGMYKVSEDNGAILQDLTFEYTFMDNLIKSSTFFRLDGSKALEKIYVHNENGNLTNWDQLWYRTDGTVSMERRYTFTEWDTSGLATKKLFYWTYNLNIFQNIYFSKNNCLNLIDGDDTFNYSFEYDSDGNVTQYNSLEAGRSMTLEYYE